MRSHLFMSVSVYDAKMSGRLANGKDEYVWVVELLLGCVMCFFYFLCALQLLEFFIISNIPFYFKKKSYKHSLRKYWAFCSMPHSQGWSHQ